MNRHFCLRGVTRANRGIDGGGSQRSRLLRSSSSTPRYGNFARSVVHWYRGVQRCRRGFLVSEVSNGKKTEIENGDDAVSYSRLLCRKGERASRENYLTL